MAELTQARAQSLFNYDPNTGDLTWRDRPMSDFPTERGWKSFQSQFAGKLAAATVTMGTNVYRIVRIDRKLHLQHRVIWLYVTGKFPEGLLDHKDGCGTNNRWENLRSSTYATNHANRRYQGRTPSGLKGAFYDKENNRWEARIGWQGKTRFLGRYATAEEAHSAYMDAARQYYGEFARAS